MGKASQTDEREISRLALALACEQNTMTLATAHDNSAWAAPVYYVFDKTAFFFFSDPDSRHIREALAGGQAAAAICPLADTWRGIRGLQMSGRISPVSPGLSGMQALGAYIVKFPFTKDFFEPGQALDLANFTERFRVRLYRFDPRLVFYLDNQIRFGFRTETRLS